MDNSQNLAGIRMPEQLQELDAAVGKAIERSWAAATPKARLERMAAEAALLCEAFSRTGEYGYMQLSEGGDLTEEQTFHYYLLNYEWAGEAKAFLLLWRDVFFELQKGYLLLADGFADEGKLLRLQEKSQSSLQAAAGHLEGFFRRSAQSGERWQPSRKRRIAGWRLQQNPWPVYREQFSAVIGQVSQLLQQYTDMMRGISVFQDIRQEVEQLAAACQDEILRAQSIVNDAAGLFRPEDAGGELPKLGRISSRLEALSGRIQVSPHLQAFSSRLEEQLNSLPDKLQLALDMQNGLLEMLELNLRKRAMQWLESEVLPLAYEAWELAEHTVNGLRVALSNIRNRVILLSSENGKDNKQAEVEMPELLQPVEAYRKNLAASEKELSAMAYTINRRLESQFKLCLAYTSPGMFLPVPLQSSISRLRLKQQWMGRLQNWFSAQAKAIRKIRKATVQEENLSISEKVVRYVKSRTISSENNHYASIFQAKGYVGESFWVGREDEMQHIGNIVDNWKQGFRGAVAITGRRFSGKSFFGEMVANRFFPENTIRISPDTVLQVQGRKLEAGHDLEEVLEFIHKNTLNQRPLAWLDDLELWASPTVHLNQNVRALRHYIDTYSNHIFFLVSLGNGLANHLQRWHNVGSLFQAGLNMDYMPASAVREAILIRHGATHKQLLDEQLEEAGPQRFNRLARRVHRAAGGNIGEALFRWALCIQKSDEDSVFIRQPMEYELPDFLNPDLAVLLSAIFIQKRSNEYQLRKLLGPPFTEKYAHILRRLLSVGLLSRHPNGWLEANEPAVNAVGALLQSKGYLKYEQWKQ